MTVTPHLVTSLLLSLLMAAPVFALELGDAKSRGLVGERTNGYVAVVEGSADAEALVADINKQRKARYQQIADKNGISLTAVQARAGQKAIGRTPAGQFVDTGSGWQRK